MDRDGDHIPGQGVKLSRVPPLQSIPDITKEVLESYSERERGCRSKKTLTVSHSLKACAEDELVKKEYKEMRCGIPGLTKSTFLMVFSPDGTKMASTHGNHNVYVTDLRTGKNIKTLVGHPRTPWCVAFHPSSNQILASGCLGGQVRIWDLSGGSEVWTADSQTVISSLAFHPVDRLLVIATFNELYFWDWSQPKPFMQTCTSNAKEKVRYVAFDRLGHKLITGIANTPQGFTRWERVRAPVPVARHSDRIAAYRRRITPRLVPPPNLPPNPTGLQTVPTTPPEPTNLNSIPERERRIAVCYRNLVEQYEMLVQRYLAVYRPATTIDRGTDPMEAEHLASTSSNVTTSGPSTSSTQTVTQTPSQNSPLSMPGPSGLSRQNTRPSKRPNVHSVKSDSSTVYQSDSSSSSDSDESPTPKRRISLVPNANMFRKQEGSSVVKVTDSSTSTNPNEKFDKRKKLFMSRSSAFHLTRSGSSQSVPGNNRSTDRNVPERYLPAPIPPVRFLANRQLSGSRQSSMENRRTVTTEEYLNMYPDLPGSLRNNRNERSSQSDNTIRGNDGRTNDLGLQSDLPLPLSRLRGISEGSLSSADEVINFSERTGREEPETTPIENPDPNEFSIENIYRNILSNLETVRNTSRNTDSNRNNSETSNILQSFSQRLENIMNQSDAILANLRQSMDILMEPTNQTQNLPDIPTSSRSFTLRRPSGFHTHNRNCLPRCTGVTSRGTTQLGSQPIRFSGGRNNRYRSNRTSRHINMSVFEQMWRPFGDHNYPRDPETNDQPRNSNVEPIGSLLTLSPRSPSRDLNPDDLEEPISEPLARSSTPVPFPADHNYPLSDSPRIEPPIEQPIEQPIDPNLNPIADHTYPRDPQSSNRAHSDYLTPLVSSLHSTISHISMQTNLLRRQVESIELIDRARFEVFQLQEMRRMWEDVRRHISFLNTPLSDRRVNNSNMSNVRQMMAWTRISDPSPSSESAQSSTEQSTPEPSPSTPDIPTPSTSRSSASSSNESRPTLNPNSPSYVMARFRQNHIKKRAQSRLYWRRRSMRNEAPNFAPRRFNRSFNQYRDMTSRQNFSNLTEITVSSMIRGLERILMLQPIVFGRRDSQNSPDRGSLERRVLSERVIQNRLRSARERLNRLNGFESHAANYLDEPVEYSTLGSRNDWMRYEARLKLSVYIQTFSRFVESRGSPIPQALGDQIKILIELTLLLTDCLLLQIMETIPASSGSFLDPERETLASRIEQLCTGMLQNISNRPASLSRILDSLRLTARYMISSLRLASGRNERQNTGFRSQYRNYRREAMLDLNRQLRHLYQYSNYLDESELPSPNEPGPSTSQNINNTTNTNTTNTNTNTTPPNNQSMSHVYRLGDLLARLRSVRGRLEQVSQNSLGGRLANNNSSSTTEHDPARSTDESPSDRESESFEGFQSELTSVYRDRFTEPGTLYRTSHVNLYPPEQSSSQNPGAAAGENASLLYFQSSPERIPLPPSGPTLPARLERPWNVPTVQVNDVPVSTTESSNPPQSWHPRSWGNRYILTDHLRPLSAATGLFRPRFLIPLYAGVNPFDADLDEGQREPPGSYDGVMTATVSPNHRIQMWDISRCHIPNISNHEKNIVVSECKIHNDGSVDISRDGTLLVTLLPSSGYLNVTNRLGIYSIKWDTLGQCLYTTSFEQNAISVSLSPISRHLIVGLASRRVTLLPSDRWTMARIFLLDDRKIKIAGRGRLVVLRDLEQGRDRDLNFMSVNCIKWIPVSGQGIVYATNTGQLKVLT